MKKWISYRTQCFLALIPILGIFIVWQISCNKVLRITKNYLYVFLTYLFGMILVSFIGSIIYIIFICLHLGWEDLQNNMIFTVILSIIASIVIAMSFVISERTILNFFNKKIENQKKRELL